MIVVDANKVVKGLTFFYLPKEDVLIEPKNIEAFPRINLRLGFLRIVFLGDGVNLTLVSYFKNN